MKGEVRKKYEEFLDHIEFAAIIYNYESNKIIAINRYAKEVFSVQNDDIREIFDGKKLRYPKELLKGGSELLFNINAVDKDGKKMNIDIDVNVFMVENYHFVLMLFEKSLKNAFVGRLGIQTPRIAYKNTIDGNIFINSALKNDIYSFGSGYTTEQVKEFLNNQVVSRSMDIKKRLLEEGKSQFNSIQMITVNNESSYFIKINRMPVIDREGNTVGILSLHNRILNKEKHKEFYETAINSNNMVNDMIDKGDTVLVSWFLDEKASVQYISGNIEKYGYTVEEFCTGKVSLKDIVYEEDMPKVKDKFMELDENELKENKISVYEYRIVKKDGKTEWIHEECSHVVVGENIVYNFSTFQNISERKRLEQELNERKQEFKLINENIENGKNIDSEVINLMDLFDINELYSIQKILSDTMYLISFLTDIKGNIITTPVPTVPLNDELTLLIEVRKSLRKYKELGQKSFKSRTVKFERFYCDNVKMSAVPFAVGDIHIGNMIVIAIIGSSNIILSDKNSRKFDEYIKLFSTDNYKNEKDFEKLMHYLWEYVQTICKAEYHNIELIKEKSNILKTKEMLDEVTKKIQKRGVLNAEIDRYMNYKR